MLAASLAASFTWIIVAAEDAPDLLQASPSAMRIIRLAKLTAAIIPVLALMAIPLAWALAQHAVTGLLMCFTVAGAAVSAALTNMWHGRPGRRGSFRSRGKSNWVSTVVEMVGTLGWAGTAFVLIGAVLPGRSAYDAPLAGLGLTISLLTLLLAWATRRRAA